MPLAAEHADDYRALMLHAYEHAADAFTSTPQERAGAPREWWVGRIAAVDGSGAAFGAFDGDRLVGTVAMEYATKPKTRHKGLLIGMFVRDEFRGHGAGRALVQAALAHARARPGTLTVNLTVTEGNAAALELYRRCGFRVIGTEPLAILTPSGYKGKVHMWQSIAAPAA